MSDFLMFKVALSYQGSQSLIPRFLHTYETGSVFIKDNSQLLIWHVFLTS